MVKVVLLDGSTRQFEVPIAGKDIVSSISSEMLESAVAIRVNGKLQDLRDVVNNDAEVDIVTIKDNEGLDVMRYTLTSQLLARAVKNLFPDSKLAIGSIIKDGFYYDFKCNQVISSHHLKIIEKEMYRIFVQGQELVKRILSKEEAIKIFEIRKEDYKIRIIEESIDLEFQIFYQKDADFIDLCYGPSLLSMKQIGAFKLIKIAGAYWQSNHKNEMLTRIYGTAWRSQEELDIYLQKIKEAEKRDHRKICQTMDLLHFQAEAPGQVFWHDKGWTMYRLLENYIREKLEVRNYTEVNTPKLINKELFVQSGHWESFGIEEMFISHAYNSVFALKPMNCPCHIQIFKQKSYSYKDLPIKISEFGSCFRQEAKGALHGLMRVASMTQDDAHIFCTLDQIKAEILELSLMIIEIYKELGFKDFFIRFADRPEYRVGDDALWDYAEKSLIEAAELAGINWVLNKNGGAFYGPKLEFVLTDAIGREWQCGTIQLDFNLPERLGASYIDANGEKKIPVMIHRALLGSMERFLGIFIEHHAGNFPLWIAPVQLVILGITDQHASYVKSITRKFKESGIRVIYDIRNERISYKIRDHLNNKVIYIGIIGDQEVNDDTITVRRLGVVGQKTYNIYDFQNYIKDEVKYRKITF
jgi:threonyl-tRNA synthetase